mgnify:FL=1
MTIEVKVSESEVRNIDDGIEFPDMPEMGEVEGMGIGDIPEQLKTMFTRGAFGKAEVIERDYGDDDRFGGIFVDKFNNPIVVFNQKPYYINKKGLSVTDFADFVAEIGKFMAPTKIVNRMKKVGNKILFGTPIYGAFELGAEGLNKYFAPETAERNAKSLGDSLKDAGIVGGISSGLDVALPPTFSILGKAVKSGTTAGLNVAKNVFPRYKPGIEKTLGANILKESDIVGKEVAKEEIPLTIGQRLANNIQLGREELLRYSNAAGAKANEIIKEFDEKQLKIIRNIANGLADKFGSGSGVLQSETPIQDVFKDITGIAQKGADDIYKKSQELYTKVKNSVNPETGAPSVTVDKMSARELTDKIVTTINDEGLTPNNLSDMTKLRKAKEDVEDLLPKAKTLNDIHMLQKSVNNFFLGAEKNEKRIIGLIKSQLDDAVFKNIDDGLLLGDEQVIKELREATGLYKDYLGLTGKIKSKNLAKRKVNAILEKLTTEGLSPLQVANSMIGHSKITNPSEIVSVINVLEDTLPAKARDQIMKKLKDAILVKAFTGSDQIKNTVVNRTAIVKNYKNIFTDSKELVERLFTKDELNAIEVFKDKVLPTIAAEEKINKSGTSYLMATIIADMTEGGLLLNLAKPVSSAVGTVGRITPLVSEVFKEGADELYKKEANEAVGNFILNNEVNPWISNTTATILRDNLRKEKVGSGDIEELPAEFRPQSELETDKDILVADAETRRETPQQRIGDVNVTSPNINITPPSTQEQPVQAASLPTSPSEGITSLNKGEQFEGLFPTDNLGRMIANRRS